MPDNHLPLTTMKITPKRIFLVLTAVILVSLGLLHLRGEMILGMFTNLQQTFDGKPLDPQFSPPRWAPHFLTDELESFVDNHYANDPGALALKQRLYMLLGAPGPPVRLREVRSIRPGFPEALRKFSNVTYVDIRFSWRFSGQTEADATQVCEALRDMPRLTTIDLDGAKFSDASLAHLAGHPNLETLRMSSGRITRASIPTFASMPSLTRVVLMGMFNATQSAEMLAITEALSGKATVTRH